MADLVGLGDLLDREQQATALASILRHNDRRAAAAAAPVFRGYALADEPGLVLASYPDGNRPPRPFPYFSEVWTGLEYTLATALVQAGRPDQAEQVVADVRQRYDGIRRNPYDEIECGHHYVRAMASWGTFLAWSGIRYDGVERTLYCGERGAPITGQRFFATGAGYGLVTFSPGAAEIEVRAGSMTLDRLLVGGAAGALAEPVELTAGDRLRVPLSSS